MSNHPFVPLRRREVRLLWGAAVVSDVGTWVQLIVVGSLVAAHTGSAIQTGLVALATFMPQGIAAPIGGLLADRFDRRVVFALALVGQALVTTMLAVALGAGVHSSVVLTSLILLGSAAGSLGAPSYAAMQPDLVPADELMAMVSLGVYSWNSGRIVGPLLGSLLVLTVGPAWTIAFNAFTFVVLAVAVAMVRRPFLPHGDSDNETHLLARLASGWRSARTSPGCWHAIALLVLFNLTVVAFMGLIPIYAHAVFHGGTGAAGLIASAQGTGAIAGGITITVLANRFARSMLVGRLAVLLVLSLVAYALAPTLGWAAGCACVLGAASSATMITSTSMIQRDAPAHARGRVMSIMHSALGVSYGIGLLFIGGIADLVNLRVAFCVGAALMLAGFSLLVVRSRHWRAAFDGDRVLTTPSLATC